MSNYNSALDNALDVLIEKAAAEVAELDNQRLSNESVEEVTFSPAHEEKMKNFFKAQHRKNKLHKALSHSLKAACALLIVVSLSALSVFSVDAWREKAFNLFFDKTAPGSEYNFNSSNENSYCNQYVTLGYIPKGFSLDSEIFHRENNFTLVFMKDNLYFNVDIAQISETASGLLDTENATVDYKSINQHEALFITKDDRLHIVWTDDEYMYQIFGNLNENHMVKIAENLKIN